VLADRPPGIPPGGHRRPEEQARIDGREGDHAQRPQREREPPIWRQFWVDWLTVPAEPERAFCCIARAIFARAGDLRLGDQGCLRSVPAYLCRVRPSGSGAFPALARRQQMREELTP